MSNIKKSRFWSKTQNEELVRIVESVKDKQKGLNKAAKHFGVSYATISVKYHRLVKGVGLSFVNGKRKVKPGSHVLDTPKVPRKRGKNKKRQLIDVIIDTDISKPKRSRRKRKTVRRTVELDITSYEVNLDTGKLTIHY